MAKGKKKKGRNTFVPWKGMGWLQDKREKENREKEERKCNRGFKAGVQKKGKSNKGFKSGVQKKGKSNKGCSTKVQIKRKAKTPAIGRIVHKN